MIGISRNLNSGINRTSYTNNSWKALNDSLRNRWSVCSTVGTCTYL